MGDALDIGMPLSGVLVLVALPSVPIILLAVSALIFKRSRIFFYVAPVAVTLIWLFVGAGWIDNVYQEDAKEKFLNLILNKVLTEGAVIASCIAIAIGLLFRLGDRR